jgi:hypothetical protein
MMLRRLDQQPLQLFAAFHEPDADEETPMLSQSASTTQTGTSWGGTTATQTRTAPLLPTTCCIDLDKQLRGQ